MDIPDRRLILEQTITLPAKCIQRGEIEDLDSIEVGKNLLPREKFSIENLCLFITDNNSYIVDFSHNDILKGKYIVLIDGKYSLNALQRLPNNKIAVTVVESQLILDCTKITIIGRVLNVFKGKYPKDSVHS